MIKLLVNNIIESFSFHIVKYMLRYKKYLLEVGALWIKNIF